VLPASAAGSAARRAHADNMPSRGPAGRPALPGLFLHHSRLFFVLFCFVLHLPVDFANALTGPSIELLITHA
jgi:hypothetical protein